MEAGNPQNQHSMQILSTKNFLGTVVQVQINATLVLEGTGNTTHTVTVIAFGNENTPKVGDIVEVVKNREDDPYPNMAGPAS